MSFPRDRKYFAANAAIITRTYRGPDRRDPNQPILDEQITRRIRFDDRGHPALDVHINLPLRRKDDLAVDLAGSLNAGNLGLTRSED